MEPTDIHTVLWVYRFSVSCEMMAILKSAATSWDEALVRSCMRFVVCVQFVTFREFSVTGFAYESLWGLSPLGRNLRLVFCRRRYSFIAAGRWLKQIFILRALNGFAKGRRSLKKEIVILR